MENDFLLSFIRTNNASKSERHSQSRQNFLTFLYHLHKK